MAWQAQHRFARISPRKARLVVDLIRGLDAQGAVNVLKFSPNRAASLVAKVLKSAIANANEAEADVERLYVQDARADAGPSLARWRMKDRGRAHPILKRTSHITVVVEQEAEQQ